MVYRRTLEKSIRNLFAFPLIRRRFKNSSTPHVLHVKNGGFGPGGATQYMIEIVEKLQAFNQLIWYERSRSSGFRRDIKAYSGDIEKFLQLVTPDIVHIHYGGGDHDVFHRLEQLKDKYGYKIIFTFHRLDEPLLTKVDCNLFVNEFYTNLPRYRELPNIEVVNGAVDSDRYPYVKTVL